MHHMPAAKKSTYDQSKSTSGYIVVVWVLVRRHQNKNDGPVECTLPPTRTSHAAMAICVRQQQHRPYITVTTPIWAWRCNAPYRQLVRFDQPHTTPTGQLVVTICMTSEPHNDKHPSTNEADPPYMEGGHPTFRPKPTTRPGSPQNHPTQPNRTCDWVALGGFGGNLVGSSVWA